MAVRIPGVEIELAGEKRILAPLNAAAVKQYKEALSNAMSGAIPDIELVAQLAHASLIRNYPELTLADVEQMVDMSNMVYVLDAVTCISGLVEKVGNLVRRMQGAAQTPTTPSTS